MEVPKSQEPPPEPKRLTTTTNKEILEKSKPLKNWFCEYEYHENNENTLWKVYTTIQAKDAKEAKEFLLMSTKGKDLKNINIRRHKKKDKDEKILVDNSKTYEVTFKIKIKDTRYQKMFLVKTNNESKIPSIIQVRCKKEFSGIRSINCITYKEWNGSSEEWSEEIKEVVNKSNQPATEIKSKDNHISDIISSLAKVSTSKLNSVDSDNLIEADDCDLDTNIFKMVYTFDKCVLQRIEPDNLNIIERASYKEYALTVNYADGTNYPTISILAKSQSNAIMMFTLTVRKMKDLQNKLKVDYLKKYATVYMLTYVETKKYRAFPSTLINKIFLNDKDISQIECKEYNIK